MRKRFILCGILCQHQPFRLHRQIKFLKPSFSTNMRRSYSRKGHLTIQKLQLPLPAFCKRKYILASNWKWRGHNLKIKDHPSHLDIKSQISIWEPSIYKTRVRENGIERLVYERKTQWADIATVERGGMKLELAFWNWEWGQKSQTHFRPQSSCFYGCPSRICKKCYKKWNYRSTHKTVCALFYGLFILGFYLWWIVKEGRLHDIIRKC